MLSTAHIFNPNDSSLSERIRAYKAVLALYESLQRSKSAKQDQAWSDRLGADEELSDAQAILDNSLAQAQNAISADELQQAKSQSLLSNDDLITIAQIERRAEIQKIRQSRTSTQSSFKQRQ